MSGSVIAMTNGWIAAPTVSRIGATKSLTPVTIASTAPLTSVTAS